MATKPAVLPEPFNGEGSWDEWSTHFENVAAVNTWNGAAKLQWLKVSLAEPDSRRENFPVESLAPRD